jgi:hypothetical protein
VGAGTGAESLTFSHGSDRKILDGMSDQCLLCLFIHGSATDILIGLSSLIVALGKVGDSLNFEFDLSKFIQLAFISPTVLWID